MARHRVMVVLALGVIAAGVMACREVPFAQDPLPGYTLLTEEVWSGGEIVLVSPRFQRRRDSIRLVIADDTLPSVYRDGDTVTFRADSLRSGTYPIAVLPFVPPALESLAEVTVRGFQTCYQGPPMSGLALPWPQVSPEPTFVADGAESAIIGNARTGSGHAAVPDSLHFPGIGMGPGLTYDPSAVVLSGTSTPDGNVDTCVWQLLPTPERGECTPYSSSYHIALITPGKWVLATHHFTWRSWLRPDPGFQLESPNAPTMSPHGDFLVLTGSSSQGQLVFPVPDGEPFRIPALRSSDSPAVFSPDGDTMYMAGWVELADSISILIVLDRSRLTEPIATVALDDGYPVDMASDPAAPLLYVISLTDIHASTFGVTVIDRRTLEQVGQLYVPHEECGRSGWMIRLLLSRNHGAMYVVQSGSWRAPAFSSVIYRFDLVAPH